MKNIINNTVKNRMAVMALLFLLCGVSAAGQSAQQFQNISLSTAVVINACGSYPASGSFLKATSVINAGNNCNTIITASPVKVYFTAKDKIILSPGFKALSGSNFIASLKTDSIDAVASQQLAFANEPVISKERTSESVTVTPNPFSNSFILMIYSPQQTKGQVSIYNSFGAKVKEQGVVTLFKGFNKITINAAEFAQGVYMLEVNTPNSKITQRIIKAN